MNRFPFRKTKQAAYSIPDPKIVRQLDLSREDLDALVVRGVPFHLAKEGKQEERANPKQVAQKLKAGATLFLVQPHEYMPRLRRLIHQIGRAAGFAGRPARSFVFRVDVPGEKAMPMHDDGTSDLVWLQLRGERFLTFGSGVPLEQTPGHVLPVPRADGKTKGWFQGGLKAGSLLYLPPFAPHHVRCRKPSLAISIYWEAVSTAEQAASWMQYYAETTGERSKRGQDRAIANLLADASQEVDSQAYREWAVLEKTRDGGCDRPPIYQGDWSAPNQLVSAWRAFEVLRGSKETVLLAGGDSILTFPLAAYGALRLLSNYGVATRGALTQAGGTLKAEQLTKLLAILHEEGLLCAGELPKIGMFRLEDLTGNQYSAVE